MHFQDLNGQLTATSWMTPTILKKASTLQPQLLILLKKNSQTQYEPLDTENDEIV